MCFVSNNGDVLASSEIVCNCDTKKFTRFTVTLLITQLLMIYSDKISNCLLVKK